MTWIRSPASMYVASLSISFRFCSRSSLHSSKCYRISQTFLIKVARTWRKKSCRSVPLSKKYVTFFRLEIYILRSGVTGPLAAWVWDRRGARLEGSLRVNLLQVLAYHTDKYANRLERSTSI